MQTRQHIFFRQCTPTELESKDNSEMTGGNKTEGHKLNTPQEVPFPVTFQENQN